MGEKTIATLQKKRDLQGCLHLDSDEADAVIGYIQFLTDQGNKYQDTLTSMISKLEQSESSLRNLLGELNENNK